MVDVAVVVAYLAAVVWIGRRAAARPSEDGFFLAGRKLGKLYQFFLNFGNATEPQGAVSTASFVYQQGAPGSWSHVPDRVHESVFLVHERLVPSRAAHHGVRFVRGPLSPARA